LVLKRKWVYTYLLVENISNNSKRKEVKMKNSIATYISLLSTELTKAQNEATDKETRKLLHNALVEMNKVKEQLPENLQEINNQKLSGILKLLAMIYKFIQMLIELKDTLSFYKLCRFVIYGIKIRDRNSFKDNQKFIWA
jgi:hypothetical protein